MLIVGQLRLRVHPYPGAHRDSMCLALADRLLTGDTLLIGATGRTDLPTGDPEALYDSLVSKLLKRDPALAVYPAHDYKGHGHSTLGRELAENPRLKIAGAERSWSRCATSTSRCPTHLTEALRTNRERRQDRAPAHRRGGGAGAVHVDGGGEQRVATGLGDLVVLDVRERDAYEAGSHPGRAPDPARAARALGGQRAARPDPAHPCYCELGKVSTLAAATLRDLGFTRAVALDGGMIGWQASGYPVRSGKEP